MTINHRPYDLISLDDDIGPRFLNSQDRQSSDPSAFDAFSTSPATQASATLLDTPYLLEPGDSTAISVNDINQGQIGDCFLLASIGELALFHPTAITSMIHSNANDTETVTLYTASNGQLPSVNTSAFAPVNVSVTNSFPDYSVNNGVNQDVVGDLKEIWPQVLEKAVATLDGGYSAIMDGGSPLVAMEELTGQSATYMSPAALTLAELNSFVSAGDLIAMDTPSTSGLPFNLVSDHAYMLENVTMQSGAAVLQLGNPWGFDQPTAIPLSQLSRGVAEVDIGHVG
ncbi:MAG: hypothetical protein QOF70_4940 [Acetobacteraceae bacterium]|jgi:Calpain family cysteine protease|nr:hypothetical protein [Acetobacteraceae bacterium]